MKTKVQNVGHRGLWLLKHFYKIVEDKLDQSPDYDKLIQYRNIDVPENSHLILNLTGGRSGTRWLSEIFNRHPSWNGSCERFGEHEAFYRYITWYDMNVNRGIFHELYKMAISYDCNEYGNSYVATPFFNANLPEIVSILQPDKIIFSVRDPAETVYSFYNKGFYNDEFSQSMHNGKAHFDIQTGIEDDWSLHHVFSRVKPKSGNYLREWENLTQIGRCAWFWKTQNELICEFLQETNFDYQVTYLSEIDQNYEFYLKLYDEYGFETKLSEEQFLSIKKNVHPETEQIKEILDWEEKEQMEFENIVSGFEFTEIISKFEYP